jgi:flagellar export protein FliJ
LKRFEFPLEKALEIRGLRKLLAEEKLGEAQREENRTRARLNLAYGMRDECFEEMRAAMGGRVDPEGIRQLVRYESSLEDEIMRQRGDVTKREAAARVALEVVVERTKEERALEKHRENRLREYRSLYWWDQGKVLDEIGAQRFTRGKGR